MQYIVFTYRQDCFSMVSYFSTLLLNIIFGFHFKIVKIILKRYYTCTHNMQFTWFQNIHIHVYVYFFDVASNVDLHSQTNK